MHVRAWRREHLDWYPQAGRERADPEYRRQQWAGWLADGNGPENYLASTGGVAAGAIRLGASQPPSEAGIGEFHALYVAPERWGRGIGTALVVFGEARLLELGFSRTIVWAYELNPRALSFYAGRGYERGEGADDPSGDPRVIGIPLRKQLSP